MPHPFLTPALSLAISSLAIISDWPVSPCQALSHKWAATLGSSSTHCQANTAASPPPTPAPPSPSYWVSCWAGDRTLLGGRGTQSSQSKRGRAPGRVLQCYFPCRWTDPGVPTPGSRWLPHPPRDPGVCEPDADHQWNPQYPGGPTVLPDLSPPPLTQQCAGTCPPPASSPWPWLSYSILGPLAAQHTCMLITGPAPLATEQREVFSGRNEGSRGPRRPFWLQLPRPRPKPICV